MSRMIGTVSRGVRAPIIRQGDDIVEIVTNSVLEAADDDGFAGKTVKLTADIDLFQGYMSDGDPVSTEPIGSTGDYDDKGRDLHIKLILPSQANDLFLSHSFGLLSAFSSVGNR